MALDRESRTERFKRQHFDMELLPGIPDDITLYVITPKLGWRVLPVLSSVNRSWEKAIRTKRVYEARVFANSTETLMVHAHSHDDEKTLALYSMSKKCCVELPQVSTLPEGTLLSYQCVAVGGKLYALGGLRAMKRDCVCAKLYALGGVRTMKSDCVCEESRLVPALTRIEYIRSREVYVLDLAGARGKWERCASMLEPRCGFACGSMDGKIYVFGAGKDADRKKTTTRFPCEVYDIQNNSWSPIMPTIKVMSDLTDADVFENKVFVHYKETSPFGFSGLGVYNPGKNEWRMIKRSPGQKDFLWTSPMFVTSGKLHKLSWSGIGVYDSERNSWINRHHNSFPAVLCDDPEKFFPINISAAKDELILSAICYVGRDRYYQSFQSSRLDKGKKNLMWQKTDCSFSNNILDFISCSIQL